MQHAWNTIEPKLKGIKRNEGNYLFLSLNFFPFQTFWLLKKVNCIYSIKRSGLWTRTTDKQKAKSQFFAAQIQIPNSTKYLGCGYKGLVFCRNNDWLMENVDKGLKVPEWLLIVQPKIPQSAPKFICPICLPKPKSLRFQWRWKKLHWASIVRVVQCLRSRYLGPGVYELNTDAMIAISILFNTN